MKRTFVITTRTELTWDDEGDHEPTIVSQLTPEDVVESVRHMVEDHWDIGDTFLNLAVFEYR